MTETRWTRRTWCGRSSRLTPVTSRPARSPPCAGPQLVDELTVEITLSEPDNDLLYILSSDAVPILEENATDISGTINGTGPFVPVELDVPQSISLGRYRTTGERNLPSPR